MELVVVWLKLVSLENLRLIAIRAVAVSYTHLDLYKRQPIIWYDDYCKDIFAEDPGLYDDVYMDLTFLEVMQKEWQIS